jgi:ABC-2 type transport system ATP-binding protein
MTEADTLSDRIAIIDHGKICALDTPENLKKTIAGNNGKMVDVTVPNPDDVLITELGKLDYVQAETSGNECHIRLNSGGDGAFYHLIDTIRRCKKDIARINTVEPTLEDVFLRLTGREMRDGASGNVLSGWLDHRARHAPKRVR